MSPAAAASPGIKLSIDGKEITVPAGTLIIRAAEQLGIEIPRFCDHPMLEPIGACRQCYVEIEGQRKLFTSCTTTVSEGMVVKTQNTSDESKTAQVANLEFLLLNHPLDCPVCDRGGECPLQDQTLSHGPGESRYVEAKRTYEKPIELSPLVGLDRERCVLCARCTRFCDQISGDRQIELFNRGAGEQVAIAPGEQFDSPFSGNTVQICPVGALTATPYRFAARPFDLQTVDTVCPHCSAGCNIRLDMRRGEVVRVLARDNEEVNDAWICDKGRFAFKYVDSPDRLTTPLIRRDGLVPASFAEAFADIKKASEGKRVAFLTGGRLCDEDYYALSKLARTVFKTNDLDHREVAGDVGAEGTAAGQPDVTYRDIEQARVVIVVGLDTEQEVPILHLRIRKAVKRGAKVVVVHPRRTRIADVAEHVACSPGGEAVTFASSDVIERALTGAKSGEAIVVIGRRIGRQAAVIAERVRDRSARFAYVGRRANDAGALRAGVHPALLPGGRSVWDASASAAVEERWGVLALSQGRSTHEVLQAAADREIDVLYLVGVDPLRDFPDAALARRAVENVEFLVVQDIAHGEYDLSADVMLPAAALGEREGHYTTWEGRGQRVRALRAAPGVARPDWEILNGLAATMNSIGLGLDSLEELQEELGTLLAPADHRMEATTMVASIVASAPPPGAILFTYPLLVDEGRMSRSADELKLAQEQPAFVEINTEDAAGAGIENGAQVRLKTEAGEAVLPARVTDHIAKGAVFVPWNQPGFQANTLLSGSFTTPVTLEPADAEVAEQPAEVEA